MLNFSYHKANIFVISWPAILSSKEKVVVGGGRKVTSAFCVKLAGSSDDTDFPLIIKQYPVWEAIYVSCK